MAKSVVIYGPMRSGKTTHGAAIAQHHGLTRIIALEDVQLMGERLRRNGFLYLSCSEDYAARAARLLGNKVVHIDQALATIGVSKPGVTHG